MRTEDLINNLQVKLIVIDVIANEIRWKFATVLEIPVDCKKKIFQAYDSSVEGLILKLSTDGGISPTEAPALAKRIVEIYKLKFQQQ